MSTEEEKGILAKFEKGMERAIDEYNNNTGISTAVTSIPVLGPIIDTMIRDLGTKISERRFLELCSSLQAEISLVDETKTDKVFLESEEGYDLIKKAFRSALDTTESEKIRLYARVLVRSAILDNAKFRHSAKDFLSILLELTPADLSLAKAFYAQQKDIPLDTNHETQEYVDNVMNSGYSELQSNCGMNNTEYDLSINKLVRAGFIVQIIGAYRKKNGGSVSIIGHYDAPYVITHTFNHLMQLIQKFD